MMNSPQGRRAGRGGAQWYVFAVTAITCFLAALIAIPGQLSVYRASARVVLQPYGSQQLEAESVTEPLLSETALEEAARQAALPPAVLSRLTLDVRHNPEQGVRIEARFSHPDKSTATALVNLLARRFADGYHQQVRRRLWEDHTAARAAAERARLEVQSRQAALRTFLEEQFPDGETFSFLQPAAARASLLSDPRLLTGRTVLASGVTAAAPDADALRREIAQREHHLETLLERMTPNHPEVRLLTLDIKELKSSLEQMEDRPTSASAWPEPIPTPVAPADPAAEGGPAAPRLGAPADPDATSAPLTPPPTRATLSVSGQNVNPDEIVEKLARLNEARSVAGRKYRWHRDHLLQAQVAFQELTAAESEAWKLQDALAETALARIEPAKCLAHLDSSRWRRFALLVALLSVGTGYGAVRLVRAGQTTFTSVDEARQELNVPVVGVLPSDESGGFSASRLANLSGRGVKLGCEIVLAAILAWMILLMLCHGPFAANFAADPLSAISLAGQYTAEALGW